MPRRLCSLFGLALSAWFTVPIIAQTVPPADSEAPITTLKVNARSVVVDVVVTDKDNRAIPGLAKDDFQIFEDGKPQTITFFEQHMGAAGAAPGAGSGAAPAHAPLALPPNTFTNIPGGLPNDAVNVLLLDALNTTTEDQIFAHKEMAKYLATVPPGIRIAIFLLSDRLHIIQGFTEDSAALHTAVAQEIANPELPAVARFNQARSTSSSSASGGVMSKAAEVDADYQTLVTLDALQQIARYLAGVPGRKNLLWFTSYNPIILSAAAEGSDASTSVSNPSGSDRFFEKSKKTVNLLANAQVSVYPIEASGVATDSLVDVSTPPTDYQVKDPTTYEKVTLREGAKDRNIGHLNMDQLARDTGGKASYNQNGLKEAMAEDINNGARYYTIAYTPTNRSEKGKERKIEVKVSSGKYNLAYRRSYFEDEPKEQQAAGVVPVKDPLRALMDRGMPNFTELRYEIQVAPAHARPASNGARAGDNSALKPPFTRYGIDFTLAADNVDLSTTPDGVRRGKIEVAIVAYSRDGKALNWETRLFGLAITPDQYTIAQQSGIPVHLDIDAPPGEIYLRTGIYDPSSSKAGTLEIPLSALTIAAK